MLYLNLDVVMYTLTFIRSSANEFIFGINPDKFFRGVVVKFDRIICVSDGHSVALGVPMIENIRVN